MPNLPRTPPPTHGVPRTSEAPVPPSTVAHPPDRHGLPPPATTAGSAIRRRAMTPLEAEQFRAQYRERRELSTSESGSHSRAASRGSHLDEIDWEDRGRPRSPPDNRDTTGRLYPRITPDPEISFPTTTSAHVPPPVQFCESTAMASGAAAVSVTAPSDAAVTAAAVAASEAAASAANEPAGIKTSVSNGEPSVRTRTSAFAVTSAASSVNRGYGLHGFDDMYASWEDQEPYTAFGMPQRTSTGLHINQPGSGTRNRNSYGLAGGMSTGAQLAQPTPRYVDHSGDLRDIKDILRHTTQLLARQGDTLNSHNQQLEAHTQADAELTDMLRDLTVGRPVDPELARTRNELARTREDLEALKRDMADLKAQRHTVTNPASRQEEPRKPFNYKTGQFDQLEYSKKTTNMLKNLVTWKAQIDAGIKANGEIQYDLVHNPLRVFYGIQICQSRTVAEKLRQIMGKFSEKSTLDQYFAEVELVMCGANSVEKAQAALNSTRRPKDEDMRTYLDGLKLLFTLTKKTPETHWTDWEQQVFKGLNNDAMLKDYIKNYQETTVTYADMVTVFCKLEGETDLIDTYTSKSGSTPSKSQPSSSSKSEPMDVNNVNKPKCGLCKGEHLTDRCHKLGAAAKYLNDQSRNNSNPSKSNSSSSPSKDQGKPDANKNNGNKKKKDNGSTATGHHLGHVQGGNSDWGSTPVSKNGAGGN